MNAYRYSAFARSSAVSPDADDVMDELARHVLEQDSLEEAMQELCRQGVERKYADPLGGLDDLVQRLRNSRRQLLDQYSMQSLLDELSEKIRSLVSRELEALRRKSSSEQERLNRASESFLKQAADVVDKTEDVRAGKNPDTRQGFARLENAFEKLFLQRHDLEAKGRALRDEEARRLATLEQVPESPGAALKKLKDYQPIDSSVAEKLASLNKSAEDIAAIERAHTQPGFSGSKPVELHEAAQVARRVLDMERLETRLRKGNVSPADEPLLAQTLGSEALVSLNMVGRLGRQLLEAGYLEQGAEGLKLSPRAMRRIGQKALSDVFSSLGSGRLGGHDTLLKGTGEPDTYETKPYGFGDSFNLHLGRTLMNALARGGGRVPIDISPRDFEVYGEHHSAECSSVLVLDLSYTMAHNGKLQAAKKVVLALDSLIRARFPRDTLHIIGFSTYARKLQPDELPHVSLSLGDPFTNIQDALRLAAELTARDRGRNRQVILITDGEPSAFCRDGGLCVDYPPTEEIFEETLKEATRLTRKGIVINTFMLDNQPLLVEFVERMTAINRGRAFFTTPKKLGEYLLVDYLARRRRMVN